MSFETVATKCFVSKAYAETSNALRQPNSLSVLLSDGSRCHVTSVIITNIDRVRAITTIRVMPAAREDVMHRQRNYVYSFP